MENSSFSGSVEVTSAIRDLGLGGTSMPASSAILAAAMPGDAVIECAVLEHGGTQGVHLGTLLDEVAAATSGTQP